MLTPKELEQIGWKLWNELRGEVRHPVPGSLVPYWDRPLIQKTDNRGPVAITCGRCNGACAIASFSAKYSGKCFACGGSGVRFVSKAAYARQRAATRAMASASVRSTNGSRKEDCS